MPKRLAEIVIDAGLASREAVVRAAQDADRGGVPLIVVLARQEGVDELALVAAIRRQVRVALVDPAAVSHDPDAIRELSRDTCRRLRVMPLRVSVFGVGPRLLHLAMADPTDAVALAEVEHITGCQVEAWLIPLSAVEEMIEEAYRSYVTDVIPRDREAWLGSDVEATQRVRRPEPPAEPTGQAGPAEAAGKPSTVPFHRVSDEASLETRHRALLELLFRKSLISQAEYEEQVRVLMKRQGEGT